VSDKNTFHFLIFVLLVVVYMLYNTSKENEKIYHLLSEQDITIQTQKKAIEYQQIYIKQMEYYYSGSYNPISPQRVD
jgi:hypothetical protein